MTVHQIRIINPMTEYTKSDICISLLYISHLHSDVQPRYVEGLEHDLRCVLSVLWCVERRLRLQTHKYSYRHVLNQHYNFKDFQCSLPKGSSFSKIIFTSNCFYKCNVKNKRAINAFQHVLILPALIVRFGHDD